MLEVPEADSSTEAPKSTGMRIQNNELGLWQQLLKFDYKVAQDSSKILVQPLHDTN